MITPLYKQADAEGTFVDCTYSLLTLTHYCPFPLALVIACRVVNPINCGLKIDKIRVNVLRIGI